jgi:putative lipoprotein
MFLGPAAFLHPSTPMSSRTSDLALISALTTAALLVASAMFAPHARAADDWFARDKALHFGASAVIAATGYGITTAFDDRRAVALAVGGGVALCAGVGKETLDALGYGTPSWKDLTWDLAGIVVGLAVAYGIDMLIRPRDAAPADTRAASVDLTPLVSRASIHF